MNGRHTPTHLVIRGLAGLSEASQPAQKPITSGCPASINNPQKKAPRGAFLLSGIKPSPNPIGAVPVAFCGRFRVLRSPSLKEVGMFDAR